MPRIPVAAPNLGEEEAEAARRVILSGWVTQGPEVAAFEKEFAAYVGAAHACAVSNCTTALHLALMAVGVGEGDEVITVSHSFIATANAIVYCRAKPVFVDIGEGGFNIDPELVEAAITPRTKAILCVHQLGMPCDLATLVAIGRRHGIPVIEDAACAIGSEIEWDGSWQKIGRPHGDIAGFSFHPRKVITTGDGGMLTTNNPRYDEKFRLWRQHGMTVPDSVRHSSAQVVFETYEEVGYNYRMTDMQAAVGRVQLQRLPGIVAARRRLAGLYGDLLARVAGVAAPSEANWARSNWQSYCVTLARDIDQREIMQAMLDAGIATRRGIMNSHLERPYAGDGYRLPRSEAAQAHSVILPLYDRMPEEDVEAVVNALDNAIRATRPKLRASA
ncbi:DegT/DnrJ/EryC1/StrS family aminotransferase [Paradevosia shaoguanensis]|uniref:GDP-perosamine synthase n=1 Tax=Paradevosia shaoguanensis TaxID=1335043 RepID=A0AA41QI66_9HYPH|nr:DegT/DnrJ/EryC1/StrS family aminotransferase [Paradevosia shaoguanensis]MCF1740886.1 DegT/DnrJ/EryC1/StrS family aminotransferase [Paradevosia shaoguanensis]MCI0125370.1 DegT/DnrJ/EryC1/StrS family aminotransferase [Paradevosia shaoguanensis]